MAALEKRLAKLPQELQDIILDIVLWQDVSVRIKIETDYSPPIGLQMDRSTRRRFAKRYYRDTTFHSDFWSFFSLARWLKSLPHEHHTTIRRVTYLETYPSPRPELVEIDIQIRLDVLRRLADIKGEDARRYLYVNAAFPSEEGKFYAEVWLPASGNVDSWRRMMLAAEIATETSTGGKGYIDGATQTEDLDV